MMKLLRTAFLLCMFYLPALAQTEFDGIMMAKHNFCGSLTYTYSSWEDYWEGTYQRNNENLGKVSTTSIAAMGNIGLPHRLNIIFGVPYIKTKASAGPMSGMEGFQDLSVFAKWKAIEKSFGKHHVGAFAVLGGSVPLTNYVADFLPFSIGSKSTTASLRIIGDYEYRNFFLTLSGNYIYRSNITIDRNAYYTDEMIYSDEVYMPNILTSRIGIGYRNGDLIIEAAADNYKTLGGFDIRKNDMPFPSNRMEMKRAGINIKVPINALKGLSVVANSYYTYEGRNAGQSLSFTGGLFYVFIYKKDQSAEEKPAQ